MWLNVFSFRVWAGCACADGRYRKNADNMSERHDAEIYDLLFDPQERVSSFHQFEADMVLIPQSVDGLRLLVKVRVRYAQVRRINTSHVSLSLRDLKKSRKKKGFSKKFDTLVGSGCVLPRLHMFESQNRVSDSPAMVNERILNRLREVLSGYGFDLKTEKFGYSFCSLFPPEETGSCDIGFEDPRASEVTEPLSVS